MKFYAHSVENRPEKDWQTLQSHALNVGEMAAAFASFFGAQEIARYTGQLHDLGKYNPEFDQRLHGFISAKLAEKTGFSDSDLSKLWEALKLMFDHDHSAALGEMTAHKLIVFKHGNTLGNQPNRYQTV